LISRKETSFLEVGTARERGRDCVSNTSTFVPNDRSQCLYCVLPIMRCVFGAHLDVGLAERQTPCRFIETMRRFLPSFQGRWPSLIRQNRCVIGCLIFMGRFCTRALKISGSFAGRDLQLKASCASLQPCMTSFLFLVSCFG